MINANSNLQLFTGIRSRCEIAVHASDDLFEDEENHGIIQIVASNAFTSINRDVAQHNLNILCPEFATYVYIIVSNTFKTVLKVLLKETILLWVFMLLEYSLKKTKNLGFANDFKGSGKLQEL